MRDPDTSQAPLVRATGGQRESVTLSPTTAGLMDGQTSTVPEAKIAEKENNQTRLKTIHSQLTILSILSFLPCNKVRNTKECPSLVLSILYQLSEMISSFPSYYMSPPGLLTINTFWTNPFFLSAGASGIWFSLNSHWNIIISVCLLGLSFSEVQQEY